MPLSKLDNILTCSACKNIYESPIILPCDETICEKDITLMLKKSDDSQTSLKLKCSQCKQLHDMPKNGFPKDYKLIDILKIYLNDKSNDELNSKKLNIENTFKSLNNLYDELNTIKQNPFEFIQSYFKKIRDDINTCRNENKQLLDKVYDTFLNEITYLETECKTKLNQRLNPYPSDDDSNSPSFLRTKIDNLKQEYESSDEKKRDTLKNEILKLEKKIEKLTNTIRNSFLTNRTIQFEPKRLQLNDNIYGKLKITEEQNRHSTLEKSMSSEQTLKENKINVNNFYIAIHDYTAKNKNEISLSKGDVLYIREDCINNNNNNNQWFGYMYRLNDSDRNLCGLVEPSYLDEYIEGENEQWYFNNISRIEAEELLKDDRNKPGAYLVRLSSSEKKTQCYSLSIKDQNNDIKHYRINKDPATQTTCSMYFLCVKIKFKNLSELISYYSKKSDGLGTTLSHVCIRD